MVYFSTFEFNGYYFNWMILLLIIFYSILFSSAMLASSKRNQKIFLICIITLSFLTGALVNPIDYGTDVIFETDYFNHVEKIVEDDPNALWIIEDSINENDIFICAGAKTINSVHAYPDFDKWHKIDPDNQYNELYNRFAHIKVDLQKENHTSFELWHANSIKLHLNINDLKKLNISYISSKGNLEKLSNEHVKFDKIYQENGYKIFNVKYY